MSVGTAWRQRVGLAILGDAKSDLFPDEMWLGFKHTGGDVPGRVLVDAASGWVGDGGGVSNSVELDAGSVGDFTLTGAVLWDAETGGNPILTATIDPPVAVLASESVVFPVGGLSFEVE